MERILPFLLQKQEEFDEFENVKMVSKLANGLEVPSIKESLNEQDGMKLIYGTNMAGALTKIKKEGMVTKTSTFVATTKVVLNLFIYVAN